MRAGKLKKRERIFERNNYSNKEQSAPSLAPGWTRTGYNGRLKEAVINACSPDNSDSDQPDLGRKSAALSSLKSTYSNEYITEMEEEEEFVEETELLTSTSNDVPEQNSDSEHLSMDDD